MSNRVQLTPLLSSSGIFQITLIIHSSITKGSTFPNQSLDQWCKRFVSSDESGDKAPHSKEIKGRLGRT